MADSAEAGGTEQDDVSFLRTDDLICLSCITASRDGNSTDRVCLAAEGFGNRMCFLENVANKDIPPDISVCEFVLEQALSVRALQEMITSTSQDSSAAQSGHRTLLYGHALLLRHLHSSMYLSCLSTSSSNDKLAFDVGLQEAADGESCWWTIHPASKQRSEGEKVRVGDDLILVSVSSERYLHIGSGSVVIASFQQTLWTVVPTCSGSVRQKSLGYVFGGDVQRLFHGDECLAVPESGSEDFNSVYYETGAVCSHARSLWRLEHIRTKWAGGFLGWGQPFRIRHVTSGRYLSVTPENQCVTVHRAHASEESVAFYLRLTKDDKKQQEGREDEGMGKADIKYGDSLVFIQHCATNLWLSYQTFETKKKGVGRVELKKAVMLVEGHMDDVFTFNRAQEEESRSARVIRKCQSLFNRFNKALDALKTDGRTSHAWSRISLSEVIKCLEDLIDYFAQPGEDEEHEEKQTKLKALRNRQDLFQEEGMIALILQTIDKFSQYKSRRSFANYAGEDAAQKWDDISSYLYLLLAAMIRGNRANCAQFAQSYRLDWLVNRLESQQSSKGVLDVLHCVLIDSPEALNMIKEKHIITIISLIDKHGRDSKVLDVLKSLCVGNGVAVRSNQNLICNNLLPGKDLLLQTKLVDNITSMKPNIYVGILSGSAMYKMWYYEVVIDQFETATHLPPVLRIGWGNSEGFVPYPGGGEQWGANGIGDDLYSYAFDGINLWTGGKPKQVRHSSQTFQRGDVIGCCLDLHSLQISFTINGVNVRGFFKDFNTDGLFFPVVSMSAIVSCRFILGGEHGRLKYGPPEDHSPVIESLLPKEKLKIEPCFYFGDIPKNIISGPTEMMDYTPFVPTSVSTSHIQLPVFIENVRDKLAENLHEIWTASKIEQGWTYGEVRDDSRKQNPGICSFDKTPMSEKKYVITVAFETLRTLLALGYHISMDVTKKSDRMKTIKLPNNFQQINGYRPSPLDLSAVQLNEKMQELVDLLSENTHNVWAKDRIKHGWTYGQKEDHFNKRSPHLVPYSKVDDKIKKANRDTSTQTVKTLLAYGYNIEPPTSETGDTGMTGSKLQDRLIALSNNQALVREIAEKKIKTRTIRGEKTYAVSSGKWYYEFEVITPGYMKVGWCRTTSRSDTELGVDGLSYAFDGFLARKWFLGSEAYGKTWKTGDIIGCMLDLHDRTVSFSLNGELMMDALGQEIAFRKIEVGEDIGYVPAFTLSAHQQGKINFGQDVNALKYFTFCGLQEGYEPVCVNMIKNMTLWFGKDQAMFNPLPANHPRLVVSRIPGGSNVTPCIKVASKTFGTLEKVRLEFMRLSLPVTCKTEFQPKDRYAQAAFERRMNMENLRQRDDNGGADYGLNENYSDGMMSEESVGDSRAQKNGLKNKLINCTNKHGVDSIEEESSVESDSHNVGTESSETTEQMTECGSNSNDEDNYPSVSGKPNLTLRKAVHRGYSEDDASVDQRRKTFKQRIKGHSLDEPGPNDQQGPGMKSASSESQLTDPKSSLTVPGQPPSERSSSKLSLITDKVLDAARVVTGDKAKQQQQQQQRGKSPGFKNIFKKTKSRDPSPRGSARSTEYHSISKKGIHQSSSWHGEKRANTLPPVKITDGGEEDNGLMDGGLDEPPRGIIPYEFQESLARSRMYRDSDDELDQSDGDINEINALAEQIDEYHYAVRVFPGQDPYQVFIGWVTPGFHHVSNSFEVKKTRHVVVSTFDMDNRLKQSVSRRNCYMVCAGDLQQRYGGNQDVSKRASPGLAIGCSIDCSTGILSFTVNGKEVANKFQVEPGTKLFPAVICEPTIKEMFQFELGSTKSSLPLSAAVFRGPKQITPMCPPRLDVQVMSATSWSRVPSKSLFVHTLKLSDIRGWSMLCDSPVPMLALHIPEEDGSYDVLELSEHPNLLNFHAKTLDLYLAVCSHGNHRVANVLTQHVTELQIMYCIQSEFLSGPLRHGFHNLLIAMHLDAHTHAMEMTKREFIIPLTSDVSGISLYRQRSPGCTEYSIKHTVPAVDNSVSIRPVLAITEKDIKTRIQENGTDCTPPFFPLMKLKALTMSALSEAVDTGAAHIRDPVGGSNENLFVPILKVCDHLLVMGLLNDDDLHMLLCLIEPFVFDDNYSKENGRQGLLNMVLAEAVKLEICKILQHLCDFQVRHRVESIVGFSESFVSHVQNDQLRRYISIKQADLPSSVTARKTREFRCPPQEQMRALLNFRENDDYENDTCPCRPEIRGTLKYFHDEMLVHCIMPQLESVDAAAAEQVQEPPQPSMKDKLMALVWKTKQQEVIAPLVDQSGKPENLQKLITSTVVKWAEESFISNQDLVREMFSLLHRQYDGIGELINALEKTYVIGQVSRNDIFELLKALGIIRSLLLVQAGRGEEALMKNSLKELMDNKVFFQHPDLMRALCVHETVMQLMVNTLNKAQQQQQSTAGGAELSTTTNGRRPSSMGTMESLTEQTKDAAAEMVVMCCRFLCYFCRTSRINQRAMFDHLSYLLENSGMLLARPSLRGSCPLDVAYSSLMDNNELALALRESNLEKIAIYLSRCGIQANAELTEKGYPDLGWDPVEGERFLDFLRFCVWVNGESVEENANLVVRLLIRRPECLGPALRGEGGGLLKAIKDGIRMSEQIAVSRDRDSNSFIVAMNDDDDTGGKYLYQSKYDFSTLPPEDDEDYIDMGGAIINFYAGLVDLLGRCAPDSEAIKSGRSDLLRARAILRSLVSMEDLEGVLGLRIILPTGSPSTEDGDNPSPGGTGGLPPGLIPIHKGSIIMFLDRVYGVEDQNTFFRILEEGLLPDLRAATTLDAANAGDSDIALALNRYLFSSVLPLLTKYSHFFGDADHVSPLLDSTLNTVYRLSKCKSLTKGQRESISDFLVAFTSQLRPPRMKRLLRKLTVDVPVLNENTICPLRMLTHHYERCGRYYGIGWGSHGVASEEEKRLTMMLFSGIFDSLAKREYDPELFSKALPCLSGIGCALSPDYTLSTTDDGWFQQSKSDMDGAYNPNPVNIAGVNIPQSLSLVVEKFAEHDHDNWALKKMESGWLFANHYDADRKTHPSLKPYHLLDATDKRKYTGSVTDSIKAMLAWKWSLEQDRSRMNSHPENTDIKRRASKVHGFDHGYSPKPYDLRNITLTRELQGMIDKLAENAHDVWAKRKKQELDTIGRAVHPRVVPFDILTDKERKKYRDHAQELMKFLQFIGYRISSVDIANDRKSVAARKGKDKDAERAAGVSAMEKRFAYSLLEKLLEYLDKAAVSMTQTRPSSRYSRRESYSQATEDVKFFGKVVLPFVEKYFHAHNLYFTASPNQPNSSSGMASVREKEMTTSLFCKLAQTLRTKLTAFGHDINISVRCLQVLVKAVDFKSVVKNCPEIVRSHLLPFFNNAADDLAQVMDNLKKGKFSHVKGTITRGATSLDYVHMVLLPVLSSLFSHLGHYSYGSELIVGDIQLASYRILNALYTLGTSSSQFIQRETFSAELARHRPALGECVGSFASCFPVAFLEPDLNKYNKNSILFGIEGKISEHSLEAQEVMDQLSENLPTLDKIVAQIEELADSGGKYQEAPHVIEVTLPMLCSYLPVWLHHGPESTNNPDGKNVSTVTSPLMNTVLGNVLKLITNNVGVENAPWMNRIATRTQPIIANSTPDMIKDHFLPIAAKLKKNGAEMMRLEKKLINEKRTQTDDGDFETEVQEKYSTFVRDIYAFYPLLIKYVDLHRSLWLKHIPVELEQLFNCVAEIFDLWSHSLLFRREEQNFVLANEIDNMALIMPSQAKTLSISNMGHDDGPQNGKRSKKKEKKRLEVHNSLNVACLKRLLPIGLAFFSGKEQELLQKAKQKMIEKEADGDIEEFITQCIDQEDTQEIADPEQWQKVLYKKIGDTNAGKMKQNATKVIERIMAMAKVMQGLHYVEHPNPSHKNVWKKVISSQRKRAVMACFRMIPVHSLRRHRAINMFLKAYCDLWLVKEEIDKKKLIEDLTTNDEEQEEVVAEKKECEEELKPDSLTQLITALSRSATKEQQSVPEDPLYMAYAEIMGQSCREEAEEDEDGDEDGPGPSFQEQEMEKQQLLAEQSRLSDRGAAEMVLLYISASKGEMNSMVSNTIDLGIALLRGGNVEVQKKMLRHLKDKKDVGFFTSVAGLMQQCSVLDLDAFERTNKAEGLGMSSDAGAGEGNLNDAEFTVTLFRFLQLLCEGHNLEFQNYLRTQAGNTTTVNIIICTVDYLLRLQESIMDFYWHYSGKDIIDNSGRENFCRAIDVAKQVFNTLTEYIQGPCSQNQLALAHSRLWDAVSGFLYIFAHMQEKLSKDADQLGLLMEFMKLQKDMMIMLLSMLEGNLMNGPIGKQMVDTLVESSANVEMILKFFDIFLKMKDLTSSESFLEFDVNRDGVISTKEFRKAMQSQKGYTREEIEYIMMCVDANQDGKVDFHEFTDRFHNPAKDIGFTMAVLLTNLSEHMTNDPRLDKLLDKAKCVLEYFEQYLGRIEIQGSSNRIERVYFEIKQSHIDQWLKPQIKESKRSFLHSVVNEGGDKEKLESFVNFCEDTIFEMQHATSISAEEQRLAALRSGEGPPGSGGARQQQGVLEPLSLAYNFFYDLIATFLSFFTWTNIKQMYKNFKTMTYMQLFIALIKFNLKLGFAILTFLFHVGWTLGKFLINMMMGDKMEEEQQEMMIEQTAALPAAPTLTLPEASITAPPNIQMATDSKIDGFSPEGYPGLPDLTQTIPVEPGMAPLFTAEISLPSPEQPNGQPPIMKEGDDEVFLKEPQQPPNVPLKPKTYTTELARAAAGQSAFPTISQPKPSTSEEEEIASESKGFDWGKYVLSLFARNFYNFKYIALALAFAINLVLLFYKVSKLPGGDSTESAAETNTTAGGDDDNDYSNEIVVMEEEVYYLEHVIRILSILHSIFSLSMLVGYYCLKVPLVIFKREKEIARKLEFEGLYVAEQPDDDDVKALWDKLVLNTASFPDSYWDKFVKKKVRSRYAEQYDYEAISNLLGMEKGDNITIQEESVKTGFLPAFMSNLDWQYQIWKSGVICTDNSFLYLAWYFTFSVLGNFNFFFFAAHLLDVAIGFKTLRTILQSVTHNGKQLVLTVMLLSVIVYIYTVIAFNFFRKFYVKEEDGQVDYKCHDMLTCFVYHLHTGVRAGGGIGDEIEPADGDNYEAYRILFDITFFFFVIVILLAIIQGLIIDAFGELRDQLEQVKEDMESKCFICGIGKDYFDKVPHGFENHVEKEHNFANYMFFLMHLINKPDTEYTGQESYVWELYQQRSWDFFPVGDCFRKQYDDVKAE